MAACKYRTNEWELLFQASRVSPVLHEAVAMLQAEFNFLVRALHEPCAECGHIDYRADDFDPSPTAHQQGHGE